MGDDGIPCIFDELPDDQLMEDCGWVLDKAHDDLDNFQFGLLRKIVDREAKFQEDLERIRYLQSKKQYNSFSSTYP